MTREAPSNATVTREVPDAVRGFAGAIPRGTRVLALKGFWRGGEGWYRIRLPEGRVCEVPDVFVTTDEGVNL